MDGRNRNTIFVNGTQAPLSENPKRLRRFLICHGIALAAMLFLIFVYRCPLYHFLHIPCPGCGVTRAYFAAMRLDFAAAFEYHPLFPLVAPVVLYAAHRNVLRKRLSDRAEKIVVIALVALFLGVYVYRLITNGFAVLL